MKSVGLDIGGANIKFADSDGVAGSISFELWRHADKLSGELVQCLSQLGPCDLIGLTMTGELADCYSSKPDGVDQILTAVEDAADGTPIHVWQTGAEFVPLSVARDIPMLVSAANWHALATWLGRLVPSERSLLMDIGSTTTDLIPLETGRPVQIGMTDTERLIHHELVYTGVRRTPIAALLRETEINGEACALASELFATTADAYIVTGDMGTDETDRNTADGRPRTLECSRHRLARMACADISEIGERSIVRLAESVRATQQQLIQDACQSIAHRSDAQISNVLISGSGRFLARRIIQSLPELTGAEIHDMSQIFSSDWADAACACAVAQLAIERLT